MRRSRAWWAWALASALVASGLGCADVHRQPPVAELVSPTIAWDEGAMWGIESIVGLSDDARVVAYRSSAVHVEGFPPTPGAWVYVFDRDTRVVTPVAQLGGEVPYGHGLLGSQELLSADGETVFYTRRDDTGAVTFHALRWREGTDTSMPVRMPEGFFTTGIISADGSMVAMRNRDLRRWGYTYDVRTGVLETVVMPVEARPFDDSEIISPNGDWMALSNSVSSDGFATSTLTTLIVGLRSDTRYVIPWVSYTECCYTECSCEGADCCGTWYYPNEPTFVGPSSILVPVAPGVRAVLDLETGAMTPHAFGDLTGSVYGSNVGGSVLLVAHEMWRARADELHFALWRGGAREAVRFRSPTGVPINTSNLPLLSRDGRWIVFVGSTPRASALEAYIIPVDL